MAAPEVQDRQKLSVLTFLKLEWIQTDLVAVQGLQQKAVTLAPVRLLVLGRHTPHGCHAPEEGSLALEPDLVVQVCQGVEAGNLWQGGRQ